MICVYIYIYTVYIYIYILCIYIYTVYIYIYTVYIYIYCIYIYCILYIYIYIYIHVEDIIMYHARADLFSSMSMITSMLLLDNGLPILLPCPWGRTLIWFPLLPRTLVAKSCKTFCIVDSVTIGYQIVEWVTSSSIKPSEKGATFTCCTGGLMQHGQDGSTLSGREASC